MHLEALTLEAKKLWPKFNRFSSFVLAGGTALALQIAHRRSVDFDFFTSQKISPALWSLVEKEFKGFLIKLILNNSEQLTVSVNGVSVSFISYPFPVIDSPRQFQGVSILSVAEVGATKAYTLGRRATYKDYLDLYFILSERHCSLKNLINLAQKKYGENFDPRLFLEELIYLEDIPETPVEFLKRPVSRRAIELFFLKAIKKIKL